MSSGWVFSLLNVRCGGCGPGRLWWVRGDWLGKFRRERRVLAWVRLAVWRLERTERERALLRIAFDIEELARDRQVEDLDAACVQEEPVHRVQPIPPGRD